MYWRGSRHAHVTVERRKLYDQVWSVPGSRLAIQYGISDVGLAKICKRYKIPRPPRGYWAKLQAGQKVKRSPLPRLPGVAGEVMVHMQGWDMPEDAIKMMADATKSVAGTQPLAAGKGPPDPLVALAGEQLGAAKPDHDGLVATDPASAPDVRVSPPLIERCLAVLDGFIKRWSSHGGAIEVGVTDDRGRPATAVAIGSDRLYIQIVESIDESKPITDPARRSGYLTLYVGGNDKRQFRRRWSDTKTQRIEKMYKPLIETLVLTLGLKKSERLDAECRARQNQAADARRKAAAGLYNREFYRRQDLTENVKQWYEAQRIREYLVALEAAVNSERIQYKDPEAFKRWFEWAQRYADAIDPTMRGKLPEEIEPGPVNTSVADLDVTSHARPVLAKLAVKDTDELWRLSDEQVRAACKSKAGEVWDEINRVLEGLGYDVSKRKSGSYWW